MNPHLDLTGMVRLTDRQKIALDRPVEWDADKGFISRDPHLRKVEAVVEPGQEKMPLGTPGRAKLKNKHFQFSSILRVDMETPVPLWHASCCFMDTDGEHLWPLARWKDWMVEIAMTRLINLIPNQREDFREKAKLDKQKYSLHMRMPVSELERSHLIAREFGIMALMPQIRDPS